MKCIFSANCKWWTLRSKLLTNYAENLKQRETDRLLDSENES